MDLLDDMGVSKLTAKVFFNSDSFKQFQILISDLIVNVVTLVHES